MNIAKNILVATDFSELGDAAVEQAIALAEKLDATLNVISVYTLRAVPESATQTRELLEQAQHETRAKLSVVEAKLRATGRLGHAVVELGEPAPKILLTASELGADLIVLGTHGRSGLGRLVMGSTAESVLRQASVPVLVVKATESAASSADRSSTQT